MANHHQSLVAKPPIHTAHFDEWNSDRHDEIFLYLEGDNDDDDDAAAAGRQRDNENFRYKLTVVDRADAANIKSKKNKFAYATAVFLIPAGRESEYMFQSAPGLGAIAASAGCARLIAVTFGRPPRHSFVSQAAVQAELTYVVQILAAKRALPGPSHGNSTTTSSIPFLALDGIGERNVLASGVSAISGRYLVEQCVADCGRRVRRLYFLDGNPFVIQSEVELQHNGSDVVDKGSTAFEYHKSCES